MLPPRVGVERFRKLMKEKGVDVLLASSPQNAYYASGYRPWGPDFGPVLVAIPVDTTLAPTMTLSGFLENRAREISVIEDVRPYRPWMPIIHVDELIRGTVKAAPKPEKHVAIRKAIEIIGESLREKGLQDSVIAIEKGLLNDREAYSELLNVFPRAKFVEADNIFFDLRKIKTPEEIKALHMAADLTVQGIRAVFDDRVEGTTIGELDLRYKRGVMQAATADSAMWLEGLRFMIASGDYFRCQQNQDFRVSKGDIIWVDCGLVVFGYTSDIGRTLSVGPPGELQKKVFGVLKTAYEEGLALVKPGVKLKEVHKKIHEVMHKNGFGWYARGHCGHSTGIGPGKQEEPPFISAEEESVFEPNMVMCVECGFYVIGRFGAFQIEEMLCVTQDGYELMTEKLPRDMVEV